MATEEVQSSTIPNEGTPSTISNEPLWLTKLKNGSFYAVILLIFAAILNLSGLLDAVGKLWDRVKWNANIMISIVGIEHYYDAKRSDDLEGPVQDLFANLDSRLASLRQSKAVQALRNNQAATPEQMQSVQELGKLAKKDSDDLKQRLYFLVRCFKPGDRDKKFCQ